MYRAAAIVAPERPPCFQALRLPLGAPGLVPPCILHRRFPFTAGDWHSVPERVRARQRGALARSGGCARRMGLIDDFRIFPAPRVMVELFGDNGVPTFVYMDVPNRLLARLVELRQAVDCRAARRLRFQGQPHVGFGGVEIFAPVHCSAASEVGKNRIERDCLSCEQAAGNGQVPFTDVADVLADDFGGVGYRRLQILA
jgi:hypothetical protein